MWCGCAGHLPAQRRLTFQNDALAFLRRSNGVWLPSPALFKSPRSAFGVTLPLVSLHVVAPSESRSVHLVAVAASGTRFYFSTARSGYTTSTSSRARVLRLVYIRLPPPAPPRDGSNVRVLPDPMADVRTRPRVSTACYYQVRA